MKDKILLLFLLVGCSTGTSETDSNALGNSAPADSSITTNLSEEIVVADQPLEAQPDIQYDITSREYIQSVCKSCDSGSVAKVHENIQTLSYQMIYDFLCSMDNSCGSNAEFMELSDQVLFALLEHHTQSLIEVMAAENEFDLSHIYGRISTPLLDPDFVKLIDYVLMSGGDDSIKQNIAEALNKAAANAGEPL